MTSPLRVDGQVSFCVNQGQTSTGGTISGHGNQVRVHADDPSALLTAALHGHANRALPALAEQLREHDLQVLVTGPRGAVATVGAGVDNNLAGRFLLGTRHVRPGNARALVPLVPLVRTLAPNVASTRAKKIGAVVALATAGSIALAHRWRGRTKD
jgi:hypothetical protein